MDPELRGNGNKQPTFKLGEDQPRGFKPVISIPIVQPAFSGGDKRSAQLGDPDLPLDLRASTCFQEYIRLIKENKLIKTTIDHVNREKSELRDKINSLQSMQKEDAENKKKRHRRNASEIIRSFECPIESCDKRYGAEASLAQHIKLKHETYYGSSEFEKYMQNLSKKQKQQSNQ